LRFEGNPLSPSMVKEMVYCPVIAWLKARHLVQEPATDSMLAGRQASGGGGLYVRAGGFSAVLDEVREEGGGVVVVERKAFKARDAQRYLAQLVAGAYILSLKGVRVRRLVLEMGGVRRELEFTSELVEEAARYLGELERLASSDRPPQPTRPGRRCSSCWYRRFCPYTE
jgi:CRISPR-associated exonuclease Cas4